MSNAINSSFDEVSEIGEILALLNAGSISHEEAKTQLEKFNTSPSRLLEREPKNGYDLNDEDSVDEVLNNVTPLPGTPVNRLLELEDKEEETLPLPSKPKRDRPKKLTNHQVNGQQKGKTKSNTNKSKNKSVLATIRKMSKKDKKKLFKELMEVDSQSNSGDDESVLDSQSDVEGDVSLATHYNINHNQVSPLEKEEEEEEQGEASNNNDRYIPEFLAKKIDMMDKGEFNKHHMIGLLNQIKRDRCSKQEAERRVCEYLNQFFAVVTSQNHEAMMIQKIYKPEFGHCDLSETSLNSFKSIYNNLAVYYVFPNGQLKIRKLGDFYVESTHRLDYNRIVFNPYPPGHENAASEKDLNMFSGLPFNEEECRQCYQLPEVKRKMDWIRNQYILKTIANQDQFAFNVFEHWFGAKIKEPWRKLNWMILFYGGFGSGKSTLMKKIIKVIFGVYCKIISDIKAVFGEFDSIKKNALIILLDESVAPETKAQEAKLTSEITSTFYTSRELYKNAEPKLCFHEYIGGVNPKNKVYLNVGDRRVFVIKTNEEMTLTPHCQNGEEREKVAYWNKVNEYLDDVRVVKAYQYHLQRMLQPDPNINIGLHAPYSKIKDELLLLQSPDSLSFAKTIITRGYIVPQCRLQDCKPELNHQFTNLQGRVISSNGGYDSPWVRELCTKDVEKEFRLLFPHSTIKNNTFWRELCHIFDIKTKEEDRIIEATMSATNNNNGSTNTGSVTSILMTRFHKNPNVKTKINNFKTFEKGSLIKKFVTKNGKIKNKTYYLWPTFSDAYSQFTAKTKLIVELAPEAKATFEKERLGGKGQGQTQAQLQAKPQLQPQSQSQPTKNQHNKPIVITNKKRKLFDKSEKYASSSSFSSSSEGEDEEGLTPKEQEEVAKKQKRPIKKRRLIVQNEPKQITVQDATKSNSNPNANTNTNGSVLSEIKVPDNVNIANVVLEQLKNVMETQVAQQWKQLKDDFLTTLHQQQQHQLPIYQPSVPFQPPSNDKPSLLVNRQQLQQQPPIQVETIDYVNQQPQYRQQQEQTQIEPRHNERHYSNSNNNTSINNNSTKYQQQNQIQPLCSTRPYPEQEIIDVYNPLQIINNDSENQLHFDSPHQNQDSLFLSAENSQSGNNNNDGDTLLLATPLLPDTDPIEFREKYMVKHSDLPKRINVNKMLEACKNNNNNIK